MPRSFTHALALAAALALTSQAQADAPCTPIKFAAGHSRTIIHGMAPAGDVTCYSIATGAGEQATLKILKGANTVFSIDGVIDAQDSYSFKTEKKTYHILVGQLMRSDTPEAFDLDVAVK